MKRCLLPLCLILAGMLAACSSSENQTWTLRPPQEIQAETQTPELLPISYSGQLELRAEPGACTRMACLPDNPCCNTCTAASWMTVDGTPVSFSSASLAERVGQVEVNECGMTTPGVLVRGVDDGEQIIVDEVIYLVEP